MIGTTVGAYRIVSQLGAGGMGVVYKALDLRLQRHVALKALPAALTGDVERRHRFLQEARAASALNDSHIITVHDLFEHGGQEFLVMELVEGRTLHEHRHAGLRVDQVVDYVGQIAEAVGVAHAAGIVHRDLKPGNIMVTERGTVKVLDFGIAKMTARDTDVTMAQMTRPGDVIGTAAYMAPEQAQGAAVDHRADIYSLGAILHELLTASGSTPRLDKVAARALERDPARRFQSMGEFASALRAASTSHAWPMRRWAAALLTTATLAGAAYLVWYSVRAPSAADVTAVPSQMPPAASVTTPATALEHTQQALGLLRRFDRAGNVEKAIAGFEAAIALNQTYAPAWAGLARAYWRQQRITRDATWGARALDASKQAIALDPLLADSQVSLGLASFESGDPAAATAAFRQALLLDPANASAHRGLGEVSERAADLEAAAEHYRTAVSHDGSDWELPRLAGNIPYRAGRYSEALEWYQKAADAAPDSAVPYRLIGAASHMLGDYAGAAAALQKSIAIEPTGSTYGNLGTALFYQGRYRESVVAFERAVERLPGDALSWGNLADAYRWVPGNREKANAAYARSIALLREELQKSPNNAVSRSRLALFLAKTGELDAARVELTTLLSRDPQEVGAWYRAAVTYELAGNRDRALVALDTALTRGYSLTEVRMDPELAELRNDVRYHRLVSRFERSTNPQ
jgi:serine/threonine-protein kinase